MKLGLFIVFVSLFLFASCSPSLMNYYFPLGDKNEVKVYQYLDKNNGGYVYWKVSIDVDDKTLTTDTFGDDFKLHNVAVEHVDEKHASFKEFTLYAYFEDGTVADRMGAVIEEKGIINAKKKEPAVFKYKYREGDGVVTITKTRSFVNFNEIQLKGKKYEVVEFKDDFKVVPVGTSYKPYSFTNISYYAKDLGLIKADRKEKDGSLKNFLVLENVLSEEEFNQLKKKKK